MKCVHQNTSIGLVLEKCLHPLLGFSLLQPVKAGGDTGRRHRRWRRVGRLRPPAKLQGAGSVHLPKSLMNLMAQTELLFGNTRTMLTCLTWHVISVMYLLVLRTNEITDSDLRKVKQWRRNLGNFVSRGQHSSSCEKVFGVRPRGFLCKQYLIIWCRALWCKSCLV